MDTEKKKPVIFGLIIIAVAILAVVGITRKPSAPPTAQIADTLKIPSELVTEEIITGTGAVAEEGKTLTVHYVGKLISGQKFDSSYDRGTPFEFTLGAGQVIPGWEQGLAGMKIGGKRKLTIPPNLAYGEGGVGTVIPPNSTLVFEVELLGVK